MSDEGWSWIVTGVVCSHRRPENPDPRRVKIMGEAIAYSTRIHQKAGKPNIPMFPVKDVLSGENLVVFADDLEPLDE